MSFTEKGRSRVPPREGQPRTLNRRVSGLYFTVSAITDETYRDQFFSNVMQEMQRAVGVRAVYLALCHRQSL